MKKKDFSHFGRLGDPGGLLLGIHGPKGLEQSIEYFALEVLHLKGFPESDEMRKVVASFAQRKAEEILDGIRSERVSDVFRELFAFERKKDLEKYCSKLVIKNSEFASLVFNIDMIGYKHTLKKRQFVPDHLEISDKELDRLFNHSEGELKGKTSKVFKKVDAIFKERKANHCHLFEKDDKWHIFYFSYAEAEVDSHWKHGPHIHFVNHLWPTHDKDEIWKSFDNRKFKDPKSLHIRFDWGMK